MPSLGGSPRHAEIDTTQTVVADFAHLTTAGEMGSGFLKGTTQFTGIRLLTQTVPATRESNVLLHRGLADHYGERHAHDAVGILKVVCAAFPTA